MNAAPSPEERAELSALLPAPGVPALMDDRRTALRGHLMTEIHQPAAPSTARRGWLAAGALTAAAAVVAAVALTTSAGGTADPGGSTNALMAVGEPLTGSHRQAVALLDSIADTAYSANSGAVPRSNQFVYVKTMDSSYGGVQDAGGKDTARVYAPTERQLWLSVDGSQAGLLEAPDATPPRPHQPLAPVTQPSIQTPTYAYLATLPTDPHALLKLIYAQAQGKGHTPDDEAFVAIGDALGGTAAPAAVSAAFYRAAALIPGTELVPDAVDTLGRKGVGVAREDSFGVRTEWIFDAKTHAFLASESVQAVDSATVPNPSGNPTLSASAQKDVSDPAVKAGTVLSSTAVITRAVVDQAGQLP
ncbi:hypothetical protein GXW83_08780 [Streptacidiphilus sp. PB12-B1b]|uniref:CU044_5270 family protein n=1 Tax=Streptacidiphilus sp. PB12-B1b TaxID=2705012 RepID=UPI0015FAC55C|nr:CU044_5270 family protein [Streptacidiphilus sp. PB12-B1b]QMU75823.1 hypothetical protein GXW83_08780 [Streptacidiphilus sp. PB12-B1b]